MRHLRTTLIIAMAGLLVACSGAELPVLGETLDLRVPARDNTLGPHLVTGPDGTVVLSWMHRGPQGATLRFAMLDGNRWGDATDVVNDPRMFVNWADLPSVRPLSDTYWVAHWLSKSGPSTYAYDVMLVFSDDQGRSWSEPVRPHTDGTPTEHGFVSIRPQGDSAALLWLDGRKTVNESATDVAGSSMTLRSAVVSPDGTLDNEQLVDDVVCDCCQTDVAVSSKGPIAVYRDRTTDEIRDIYVTRFADGAWQPGVAIADDGWEIAGCPVNGPAIDADGDLVAIAWFSAADNAPIVRASWSTNGGETFSDPVEIASGQVSGHVGVAIVDQSSAAVSWVESGAGAGNALNIRALTTAGKLGAVTTVGHSGFKRIHPQLAHSGDGLVLAWTEEHDETTRIATAFVPLAKTPAR